MGKISGNVSEGLWNHCAVCINENVHADPAQCKQPWYNWQ